jgi:hypothetical protein
LLPASGHKPSSSTTCGYRWNVSIVQEANLYQKLCHLFFRGARLQNHQPSGPVERQLAKLRQILVCVFFVLALRLYSNVPHAARPIFHLGRRGYNAPPPLAPDDYHSD